MSGRWADPLTDDHSRPMSPEERDAFERECRDQTESICLAIERDVPGERRETRSVSLQGEYPETRVVVEWWDRVLKRNYRESYPLWRQTSWAREDGRYADPQYVGNMIATWVHES